MLFRQFVDDDLGCGSYLVGCEAAGIAAVVDPAYAIEQYLDEAERRHVRITCVVETHTHADHLSGHGRFALEHGVPVYVSPLAGAEYPSRPLEDGTEIVLGNVVLRCIPTPGHRPEHCAIAVVDTTRADEPWLVLTGDSLFVGEAARPDLAVGAVEGAEGLYGSLRRLLELADGVEVYPGHVAGSLCGAGMSSKGSSTIGFERRFNPAIARAGGTVDEFVRESAAVQVPKPPNLARIVGLNRGPWVPRAPELRRLDSADGATVLDVRPVAEFGEGHVPGAFNVPLGDSGFGTRAGFVLDPAEAIAIHAGSPADGLLAARRLQAVGFLELAGVLWLPPVPATMQVFTDIDAVERVLHSTDALLVDVRDAHEFARGTIPGSINLPYREARARAGELPADRVIVPFCESGVRAGVAGSILLAAGLDARPLVKGGVSRWLKGRPLRSVV